MLKARVIATLLYKDYSLAKGWGFEQLKPAGNVLETIKVYTLREVDEIIFFNITAAAHPASIDATLVKDFSQDCFTPLTVGGGVRTLDDVGRLLDAGANKVSINTAAVETPDLIDRIAQKYGAGVCTVSIDYRRKNGAKPEVYTACGTRPIGLDPVTHARQCALRGANEILLTCIERDGTHIGYDLDVLRAVSKFKKTKPIEFSPKRWFSINKRGNAQMRSKNTPRESQDFQLSALRSFLLK